MAFTSAIGAYLSNQQAKKQQRAANDVYSQQQVQLQQNQAFLNPYNQAGTGAVNTLNDLLVNRNMGAFQASPGYQFRLNEGINSLNRLANARGQLFSGNQAKEVANYSSGLASEEFQNYINQLMGLTNTGLSAATNQANLGGQAAPGLGELALQGAYNHFNKGTAFDAVLGSALQLGTAGMVSPNTSNPYGGGNY
jgi:hypothetical protein